MLADYNIGLNDSAGAVITDKVNSFHFVKLSDLSCEL